MTACRYSAGKALDALERQAGTGNPEAFDTGHVSVVCGMVCRGGDSALDAGIHL